MRIAVFCSANAGIAAEYAEAADNLGRWAGEEGHTVVFGGCNLGLMERVAAAARQAGGRTIGVIPTIIERGGKASENVDVKIPCDNLSDRKDIMLAHSDIVVALPGGLGTLDEVFTVAASATIGYHNKPVVLYNVCGFWNSLTALLDDLQQKGMIRGRWTDLIQVADSLDDVKEIVRNLSRS